MRLSRFQRWLGGLAVVVVTCVGAALLAATSAAAATNLVTNGDFEAGTTSGWSCGTSAAIVTTPVHGGTHALQLTPTSSDDAQCTQTVSVQPNSAYTLSDWVEGSFVFIGATGTGSTDPSTFTQAASAFTQLSVSFTTGASTTSVSVFVHGWFAQPTDVVDDVVLTGPAGTGTTPPPTNPPPSAPSAPAGLHATGTTSSSVSLAWTAASGATSYNVYRNGTKVGSATSTSFTDTGLAASTTFSYAVTGVNTAGESAKSTAVSATTSAATTPPPSNTGLPAHILTGYWQDFVNGATVMRLSAVPTTYDLVAVAFANATTTPGAVSYDVDSGLSSALGGYTDANFTSDIATLHSRGQKVIISVGGANGTISVADSTSATNFANSVNSLITRFGFDGVDIDLENGVNPTFMSQALHSIAAAHPGVIITLAPQTVDMQSTGGDYFQLALDIKSILTVVNMQYYNSGTMNGCDGNVYAESTENFMTALACIQLQGGLSPSQIGLGLPASSSAAGGGVVAPSLVNNAMDCLDMGTNCGTFKPATTAPGFRGAMTWSINWDASNGFAFANTVHPHLASLR
ncbi:MAG TPA: glycoside hydrolase family 18 protein [Pseudonocardiaceae bacterium]